MTSAPSRKTPTAAVPGAASEKSPDAHGPDDPSVTEAGGATRFPQPDWKVEQGLPVAKVERRPGHGRTPWWWAVTLNERVIKEAHSGFRGADEAWAAGQTALRAILAGRLGTTPPV